ncbi:MAG: glycosyltransferase family 2 protein, partial [Blastocatellia bacterium]
FKYCVFGKQLRGSLYPPRKVLYRRKKARYEDDGHTQRVRVEGQTAWLSSHILHDDRKSLSRWLSSQDRYALQEVKKLLQTPHEQLGPADLMRRSKVLMPFVSLFYCLIIQRGILDGWAGWYYALQRLLAEALLAIGLIEDEQLNSRSTGAASNTPNY